MSRYKSCVLGVMSFSLLPFVDTSAATLARQSGAVGIVTYDSPETHTTDVPVPYAWLARHDSGVVDEPEAYEAAAKKTAANGRKVWECYVLGLDPEDETNDFKIVSFPMKSDGTPDLDAITISPPKSQWNVNGATPVLKGKATMEGEGEWQTVTDENKAQMKFFKVEVVVP